LVHLRKRKISIPLNENGGYVRLGMAIFYPGSKETGFDGFSLTHRGHCPNIAL
jgi:hypothetical protein